MQYFIQDLLSWVFYSSIIIAGFWLVGLFIKALIDNMPEDEG